MPGWCEEEIRLPFLPGERSTDFLPPSDCGGGVLRHGHKCHQERRGSRTPASSSRESLDFYSAVAFFHHKKIVKTSAATCTSVAMTIPVASADPGSLSGSSPDTPGSYDPSPAPWHRTADATAPTSRGVAEGLILPEVPGALVLHQDSPVHVGIVVLLAIKLEEAQLHARVTPPAFWKNPFPIKESEVSKATSTVVMHISS